MQSKALAQKKKRPSTQQYLDIAEIKNDTVILKDGTIRGVILVSSLNFNLKSEDEQRAIISAYVGFLNSFDYPVQIVIQSRRLRIDSYLEKLAKLERLQSNELLRTQMGDYRNFVMELVELGEIMTKKFFVVVPLSTLKTKEKKFFSQVTELLNPASVIQLSQKSFLKKKRDLDQRVEQIRSELQSMGLATVRLDTQSLIELYYNVYNPSVAHNQPLPASSEILVDEAVPKNL